MQEPIEESRRFRKLYALVLAALAFEIVLMWAITRIYA